MVWVNKLEQLAEAARSTGKTKELRDRLSDIYPDSQYNNSLKPMNDDQVIEQSELLPEVFRWQHLYLMVQEKRMSLTC